jgi:hypothetical protein
MEAHVAAIDPAFLVSRPVLLRAQGAPKKQPINWAKSDIHVFCRCCVTGNAPAINHRIEESATLPFRRQSYNSRRPVKGSLCRYAPLTDLPGVPLWHL